MLIGMEKENEAVLGSCVCRKRLRFQSIILSIFSCLYKVEQLQDERLKPPPRYMIKDGVLVQVPALHFYPHLAECASLLDILGWEGLSIFYR